MLGIYSDPQLRDAAAALHALPREALLMSKLSVFISSSGDRSRQLAEFLCKWLRGVLHHVDPWMSGEDIEKGRRWFTELFGTLEETRIGIACMTPENAMEPWLVFECGVLAKTLSGPEAHICPYLLGLSKAQVGACAKRLTGRDFVKKKSV
jgi:hypothetical protein